MGKGQSSSSRHPLSWELTRVPRAALTLSWGSTLSNLITLWQGQRPCGVLRGSWVTGRVGKQDSGMMVWGPEACRGQQSRHPHVGSSSVTTTFKT